jgi:hypothetical protein
LTKIREPATAGAAALLRSGEKQRRVIATMRRISFGVD